MGNKIWNNLGIEKLVYRGNGLGHHERKAVFVPFTAPGDVVSWRPVREKKHFIQGRLMEVEVPSKNRLEPCCPYFEKCGGCQWQHLNYDFQLLWKHRIVTEILEKNASIPGNRIGGVLPSSSPWQYRKRARLAWDRKGIGFYQNGSHRVIPVRNCALLNSRLNRVLSVIRDSLMTSSLTQIGREILLEVGDEGNPRVILRIRPGAVKESEKIRDALGRIVTLAEKEGFSLWVDWGRGKGPTLLTKRDKVVLHPSEAGSMRLDVPPGGFFQANLSQNRRLTALVLEAAEKCGLSGGMGVLDLYCGMGNFSLPLALRGWRVRGVDSAVSSVEAAKENAVMNGIGSARFIHADAGEYLQTRLESGELPFSVLILDPPRTGTIGIARLLTESVQCPELLIYVSCDPMTLARDLKILAVSYEVQSVVMIDMFPQTFHIETVTVLRRR